MLGLLVQNQSHRAGTHLRGKLLRRIAHQTFFSGEMVSANPGAVQTGPPTITNCGDPVATAGGGSVAVLWSICDDGPASKAVRKLFDAPKDELQRGGACFETRPFGRSSRRPRSGLPDGPDDRSSKPSATYKD